MNPDIKSMLWFCAGIARVTALGAVTATNAVKQAALPPLPKALSAVSPKPPQGIAITLAWNHSPDAAGYRIYATTNKAAPAWRVLTSVGYTNHATLTNVVPPMWFTSRAVDANGVESTNSNIIGVTGWDAVLSVWSEVSSNGSGFKYLAPVVTVTNPLGMEFFRTAATITNRLRVE